MSDKSEKTVSFQDQDLSGKVVVVKGFSVVVPLFECSHGFGCSPASLGKICGKFLQDGEECYIRRSDVVRIANAEDLESLAEFAKLSPSERYLQQEAMTIRTVADRISSYQHWDSRSSEKQKLTKGDLIEELSFMEGSYLRLLTTLETHKQFISHAATNSHPKIIVNIRDGVAHVDNAPYGLEVEVIDHGYSSPAKAVAAS